MNKYLHKFLLLLLILTQCKSISQNIEISIKKVDQEILARNASDDKNSIITIQFPKEIILTNHTANNQDFLKIIYKYNNIPYNRDLNLGLYTTKNGILSRITNNKKKTIPGKQSLNYLVYTRHFIDSTQATQQQLRPYIEKMLEENKDTLHIGTVSEFKTKHAALFEKLTKNDSISIQFLDGKELGEQITVPVEW